MFGQNARLSIAIETPAYTTVMRNGQELALPLLHGNDDIVGKIQVTLKSGKKLQHKGITVELIGCIDGKGITNEFLTIKYEQEPAGIIKSYQEIQFEFLDVEKTFESYNGLGIDLKYFIRVVAQKQYKNIVAEKEIIIVNPVHKAVENTPCWMVVGNDKCLHIDFEYNSNSYHLQDWIRGNLFFSLIQLNIKHMEVFIIKQETYGVGKEAGKASQTVANYEVMDGTPMRGEHVPIRMFLSSFPLLTPTYINVYNTFSVRYFLHLVLIDEDDRRYFKKQEITLWRKI